LVSLCYVRVLAATNLAASLEDSVRVKTQPEQKRPGVDEMHTMLALAPKCVNESPEPLTKIVLNSDPIVG
jgi:hypothetical protein